MRAWAQARPAKTRKTPVVLLPATNGVSKRGQLPRARRSNGAKTAAIIVEAPPAVQPAPATCRARAFLFPHPTRHSRTPPIIPAPHPSFRRKPESSAASVLRLSPYPNRHSRTPPVIPAQAGIWRRLRTPPFPAPHPSFRRKPESGAASVLRLFPHPTRHSGASRNLVPLPYSAFPHTQLSFPHPTVIPAQAGI